VANTRACEQCGAVFAPRREHARFCGVRCRPASRAPGRLAWETTQYQAYQAHLSGHTIGETFGRTAAFLRLASADAQSVTVAGTHAGR
jgi:hypothetical protein